MGVPASRTPEGPQSARIRLPSTACTLKSFDALEQGQVLAQLRAGKFMRESSWCGRSQGLPMRWDWSS
jgi:hypothetical protein